MRQAGYEDYRRYYMEYVTKAAADRGILPIYWDNGSQNSGEEAFGLFNRDNNTVLYPAVLDAMLRAVTDDYSVQRVFRLDQPLCNVEHSLERRSVRSAQRKEPRCIAHRAG